MPRMLVQSFNDGKRIKQLSRNGIQKYHGLRSRYKKGSLAKHCHERWNDHVRKYRKEIVERIRNYHRFIKDSKHESEDSSSTRKKILSLDRWLYIK